jgi:two-component system chemotaxis sensor kinase CheA
VGELITATATASLAGRSLASAALHEAHSTLAGLVQEVRDSALQLRMVKIGATFNRFQRVVHDVSREIGKDIGLHIQGEDTELDKTVVEKIADPLTHLVRNSMDHGIEPAHVRAERGKPARGTVSLNAYHDSGSIVIEVGDDGGGLPRDKILAKAVERGLVEPGKQLSDQEVYGLIFEPGFSTADQVTNLSGRGVGMDVVKRNITALRGAVSIDSRPGQGATVTIRLPLTLAIINGFQVAVGESVFVLPLDAVEECIEFRSDTGHDYTELRRKVLPFIELRKLFKVSGHPSSRQSLVVVRHGNQRFGLVVDRLLGEAQTVIKPLASMFSHLHGISGSSILGSGEVALILDVPALAQRALVTRLDAASALDAGKNASQLITHTSL